MSGSMWKRTIGVMIGSGLAFAGLAMLAGAGQDVGEQPACKECSGCAKGTQVTVTGEGEYSVEPDRAEITVGATFEAATAAEAQEKVNKVLTEAIDDIKRLKIDGMVIQTSSISLSPVYDRPRNDQPHIRGYMASNTVRVRVDDVSRIGEVLDVAVASDANQGFGISFMLRDPEDAKQEALARAVHQAKRKAQTMGEALGMKILAIESVSEQGAQPPTPVYRGMERMAMADAAMAAPVESGELTVRASVTLVARVGAE